MRAKRFLLICLFAAIATSELLPGAGNDALAQFSCGPNDTICVPSMGWCEPVTTPAARAMCPRRGGGGGVPRPRIERNVTRLPPRTRPEPAPRPGPGPVARPTQTPTPAPTSTPTLGPAPTTREFEPTLADQIKPLQCPAGFARTRDTFYGGTRCGPVGQAKAASLPSQPPASENPKLPSEGTPATPLLRQPVDLSQAKNTVKAMQDFVARLKPALDEQAANWEKQEGLDKPPIPFVPESQWTLGK